MADALTAARESIRAVAQTHGLLAVFLPKLFPMAAGNGNHVHLSLSDATTGQPVFARTQSLVPAADNLSDTAQSFMEGILVHLPALLALTLPTTNSFRRVGPGCWTGSATTWAFDDKESPLRVAASTASWNRVEYKLLDNMANPYLALAGILSAGLSGIAQNLTLRPVGDTTDSFPTTLTQCLDALEQDEMLVQALSPALVKGYLACRREKRQGTADD